MNKPNNPVLPGLVIAAGLVTLLASSLTDEDDETQPVPVTVEYTLESTGGLSRDTASRMGTARAMRLAGSYDANSGNGLRLRDRSFVELDDTSSFVFEITLSEDELSGTTTVAVTAPIDFRLDGEPSRGGFRSDFVGTDMTITTAFVDFMSSDVNLSVAGATRTLSLQAFSELEDNDGENLDERMASAAYNMLSAVLRGAFVVEENARDIEASRSDLEATFDTQITVACSNPTTGGDTPPEARLKWTEDADNAGDNRIADGDGFEARYFNCYDADLERYLDGTVTLTDYFADSGDGLRRFAINADLSTVFVASDPISIRDAEPGAASPRYNGTLSLDYFERERIP